MDDPFPAVVRASVTRNYGCSSTSRGTAVAYRGQGKLNAVRRKTTEDPRRPNQHAEMEFLCANWRHESLSFHAGSYASQIRHQPFPVQSSSDGTSCCHRSWLGLESEARSPGKKSRRAKEKRNAVLRLPTVAVLSSRFVLSSRGNESFSSINRPDVQIAPHS